MPFKSTLLLFLSLLHVASAFQKLSDTLHASHADYVFLQDDEGKQWIYKQMRDTSPEDQMVIVLEALASDIAAALGIPINCARLLSGTEVFPQRIFDSYPGSLHLKVAGTSVEESPPWEDFDIHQKFRSPFRVATLGPLNPEEVGLRKEVIKNMAKHRDLPQIVALDTYLGNVDRSPPNIFYDATTDRFYGIDMGNCFKGNLAQAAHANLTLHPASFVENERNALQEYRQALIALTVHFPPSKMFALLHHYLELGGFVPSNALLWSAGAEQQVTRWKKQMEKTYENTLDLIEVLRGCL